MILVYVTLWTWRSLLIQVPFSMLLEFFMLFEVYRGFSYIYFLQDILIYLFPSNTFGLFVIFHLPICGIHWCFKLCLAKNLMQTWQKWNSETAVWKLINNWSYQMVHCFYCLISVNKPLSVQILMFVWEGEYSVTLLKEAEMSRMSSTKSVSYFSHQVLWWQCSFC